MIQITATQENILRQLAQYKFLTISQIASLGTAHKDYIQKSLLKLRQEPLELVGVSQYGGVYKKGEGRAENMYYLTLKGAKFLVEHTQGLDIEQVHYPKSIGVEFRNDYQHRIYTVNVQISFEKWIEQNGFKSLFFHSYFHKNGSMKGNDSQPLKSITKINITERYFIEPDAIFMYDTPTKRQLMICEVSNGKDTKRVVEQLKTIADAIGKGVVTDHYKQEYNYNKNPRVLCVIETENLLKLVLKKMNQDPYFAPEWNQKAFFFKVVTEIKDKDFGFNWQNMKGVLCDLKEL